MPSEVRLTVPPLSFFKVRSSRSPRPFPPPASYGTIARPFKIPENVYHAALRSYVPVTIALVYIVTITMLNSVNRQRGGKPWALSKTRLFKYTVMVHNAFLAIYSAWTFVGMFMTLQTSTGSSRSAAGFAGVVHSLCKISDLRANGSIATPNDNSSNWDVMKVLQQSGLNNLAQGSLVDTRLWNAGLAYYGWIFYLSKFYEVVDTLIIIAKGKQSSFLQTYHHAGAMLCMWAGIRYMSPPIWIFVLFNSFIHSIMYTYYLLSSLRVRLPRWFKQTLTTLQISQFVVGTSIAASYLFIKYQVPSPAAYLPYLESKIGSYSIGQEAIAAISASAGAKEWTHCLDTSGQTFAVLINVAYLLPLTYLFSCFFIKSYLRRK